MKAEHERALARLRAELIARLRYGPLRRRLNWHDREQWPHHVRAAREDARELIYCIRALDALQRKGAP